MKEHKEIVLELAPPRRLFDPGRFRSFKLVQDRSVWAQAWERVDALLEDGWQVDEVEVQWGKSIPLTPLVRESALPGLCRGYRVVQTQGHAGQGRTVVKLIRA